MLKFKFVIFSIIINCIKSQESIDWQPGDWAMNCDFSGNDLRNSQSTGEECSNKCKQTRFCTHYSWNDYNGGTCWMKKGPISKSNAFRVNGNLAVCGLVTSSSNIEWQNGNWAFGCDFVGNDLSNALTRGEDCSTKCSQTPSCSHYTWTNYNGGTCWMKQGSITKENAVSNGDLSKVCGILRETGVRKGDLIWSDEFNYNGKPDSSKWRQETGGSGWGNNEAQFYTDSKNNAYVTGGNLVIEARKENYGDKKYTSARLVSKTGVKYGVFEMRARLPRGRGTWPAFWLLPSRAFKWPRDGEIDIMEHVGYDPGVIHATIHDEKYNHIKGTQKEGTLKLNNPFDEFHVYTLDWNAKRIIVYIDNKEMFRFGNEGNYNAWPFDFEFNVLLNLAIGGNWGGVKGIDDFIFPSKYIIDYIRVYKSTA